MLKKDAISIRLFRRFMPGEQQIVHMRTTYQLESTPTTSKHHHTVAGRSMTTCTDGRDVEPMVNGRTREDFAVSCVARCPPAAPSPSGSGHTRYLLKCEYE
jgi:hypothetical protein